MTTMIERNIGVCHRIRAIEYRADGTVKRVEYHAIAGFAVYEERDGTLVNIGDWKPKK